MKALTPRCSFACDSYKGCLCYTPADRARRFALEKISLGFFRRKSFWHQNIDVVGLDEELARRRVGAPNRWHVASSAWRAKIARGIRANRGENIEKFGISEKSCANKPCFARVARVLLATLGRQRRPRDHRHAERILSGHMRVSRLGSLGTWRVVAQYVLLFVTTYVSVFSVYDIYDDCVRRYVNDAQTKSDAVVCAQLCPICPGARLGRRLARHLDGLLGGARAARWGLPSERRRCGHINLSFYSYRVRTGWSRSSSGLDVHTAGRSGRLSSRKLSKPLGVVKRALARVRVFTGTVLVPAEHQQRPER